MRLTSSASSLMPASYLKRGKELHCSVMFSYLVLTFLCYSTLLCKNSESWSSFVKKILRKEDIKIVVLRCFLIGFNDTKFESKKTYGEHVDKVNYVEMKHVSEL